MRKTLLVCGILAALNYIGTDILGAALYPGYSYTGQTISELFAINAPTRPLVTQLLILWGGLITAFGVGVWFSAGANRALRVVGGLLLSYGLYTLLAPDAPMHQREILAAGGATRTDTMHIAMAVIDMAFLFSIITSGAVAISGRFRLYSIASILVMLIFGGLAGMQGPRVAANLPTPWVGLTERISVYAAMIWLAVLATLLLRQLGISKAAARPRGAVPLEQSDFRFGSKHEGGRQRHVR